MGGARLVAVVTVRVKCPGSTFLLGICPGISLGFCLGFFKMELELDFKCNIAHFYSASSANHSLTIQTLYQIAPLS